jgi:hypothetical protein
MQVTENNALFAEVYGEESAIVSGGQTSVRSYNFIGLATFFMLVLILWGLDEGLLNPNFNNYNRFGSMST